LGIELRQLRYFVAVARAGSFVAAGEKVRISQPALGHQIKHLEKLLCVSLFTRHSRGVMLTEAGKIFLPEAEKVLRTVDQAAAAISPYRDALVGDFELGVTPTAGRLLLPDLLSVCTSETRLKLSVREGLSNQLSKDLNAGSLDMALCYHLPCDTTVEPVPLYREDLFLVGPPDLVLEHDSDVDFNELTNFPLILGDRYQVTRRLVEETACERKVHLDIGIEMASANVKRELIVRHRRATIVPYGTYLSEIRAGQLRARRIVNPTLTRHLHFVFRRGVQASVRAFLLSAIKTIVDRVVVEHELAWKKVA
jgi:LysR family transcriptional regulator, nitrogen assimilation regulatory protein